jgi:hypothetical protein
MIRNYILYFILCVGLLCSPQVASITETETGEITGQIVDETGHLMEGVRVTLHGSKENSLQSSLSKRSTSLPSHMLTIVTTTTTNGYYKFKNLPIDQYFIETNLKDSTGALIEAEVTKEHLVDTMPVTGLKLLGSIRGSVPDSLRGKQDVYVYLNKVDRFISVNKDGSFTIESVPSSDYKLTFVTSNQGIQTRFDSIQIIVSPGKPAVLPTDDFTIAYFGFEENQSTDSLFDLMGQHKGVLKGAKRTPGYSGNGIECTYGKFAQFDSIIPYGISNGTIDFYFRTNNTFNNDSIYSFLGNRGARVHVIYNKGSIYFQKNHDNIHKFTNYKITFTPEKWYHMAVTWGTKGMRIFIDNKLIASNTDTSNYMVDTTDATFIPFYIGYKMWGGMEGIGIIGSQDYYFDGIIDELHISSIERY